MRDLISSSPDPIAVASVSCLEIAWLAKKGRISLPVPIDDFFVKAIDGAGLVLLSLTPRIAARSAFLPDIHRDPIDRVLIATAQEHDADLVTRAISFRATRTFVPDGRLDVPADHLRRCHSWRARANERLHVRGSLVFFRQSSPFFNLALAAVVSSALSKPKYTGSREQGYLASGLLLGSTHAPLTHLLPWGQLSSPVHALMQRP